MEHANRPNILLLMADQFRWDCLGIAGHPDVKTPNLDSLAARGLRFSNAVSACPTCIPARAAALTGMSQEKNGRVGYQDGIPWHYAHTLPGEMTAAGYQTRCVGKMHVHPPRANMGYEEVELHDGYLHYYRNPAVPLAESQLFCDDYLYELKSALGMAADITDTGLECNTLLTSPWPYEEKYHPTNWVASHALRFLDKRDPTRPFFLKASFVRPHPPFDPPKTEWAYYIKKDLRPPYHGDWDDAARLAAGGRITASDSGFADPALIHDAQAGYYALISHLDRQIGRIVESLVERHLWENTLIVFVSDHGEMLGDHFFARKSLPYNGSMRVPLLFSGGALTPSLRGKVTDFVAELRDLAPTLLSLIGAPVPETMDGVDLFAELQKKEADRRAYIHGEHSGSFPHHYIMTKEDKFIWFADSGREQYFRADDLKEQHDGIADPAYRDRICKLRSLLINVLTHRPEGFVQNGCLTPGCPYGAVIPEQGQR